MAGEVEKYRIPLFDGTNFSNWKFRMETLLNEMDLLQYVEEAYTEKITGVKSDDKHQQVAKERQLTAHQKQDRKCKSQIIQRIADSHLEYARDKETAFELWTALENTFERKGIASQLLIRKSLLSMKFDASNDTLSNHFLKFDKLIRDLRTTGGKLEELDIVCHLLLTMPSKYDSVVTAIETLSSENLTVAFVKNRLMDEETKRNDGKKISGGELPSSSVFVSYPKSNPARPTSRPGQGEGKPTPRFPYCCNYCKRKGHKWIECKKRAQDAKTRNSRSANVAMETENESDVNNFCFSALTSDIMSKEIRWFLDSGATEHLVSSNVKLSNAKEIQEPVKIKVAKSGSFLEANLIGEIKLTSLVNGKKNTITVKEVLSVPKLQYNLLSVRKLEMNGFQIIFENGRGLIMKENQIIAVAVRNEIQLYEINFRNPAVANISTKSDELQLWHKRMGHLNFEDIKRMQSQTSGMKINFSNENKKLCEVCIEGKQASQPHNQKRQRATRPLQLVHSDLIGPISPISHDLKKYVLTFIDDYTHFVASYILSSKTEVLHFFKIFEAMVSAHFNMKISRFRCDNGREYISKEIKEFFENLGIQFEFTIRYTPQQNGVAERMNCTILEKARCMLLNCKLKKLFWSEAVQAAVYLINRSPTTSLNGKIPAALWFGDKPNVSKLKIFGCIAYLKIPKQILQGKFDSRSLKCFFVGYCPNGYKFWSPENHKIIFGKDAIFDETKFSFDGRSSEEWIHYDEDEFLDAEEENSTSEQEENHESKEEDILVSDQEEKQEKKEEKTSRRSMRERKLPKYLEDYAILALHAETFVEDVPTSFEDIAERTDKDQWMQAVIEEMDALIENETWELTSLPSGKRAINNKWVFKVKHDEDKNLKKYKARLVIKGCAQREGFDYEETYAPVARISTLRTLLSIVVEKNLFTCHMDVKNAFLHGKVEEELYMKIPEGFKSKDNSVCKLKKALYGLKQAPRAWNKTIHDFLIEIRFQSSKADRCLYIWDSDRVHIFLVLYVDDIFIAGNNQRKIDHVKDGLKNKFRMKDLGIPRTFLGINLELTNNELHLSQRNYFEKLLRRFEMENCNPASTPMELTPIPENQKMLFSEEKPYRELVGCLMYGMLATRPDLSFAVNYFSRYQHEQTESRWKGLKRILRYIKGTMHFTLCYKRGGVENLACYVDADFGSESDRKSTSGFLFQVFGNTVAWTTRRQTSVSLSSTEAEYVALATAAAELIWLKNLLADFNIISENPPTIYEDNQSCIHLLSKWEHKRLKHVDVKYNFVRDLHEKKLIKTNYISTKEQVADILTKPLPKSQFEKLRIKLGIQGLDRKDGC